MCCPFTTSYLVVLLLHMAIELNKYCTELPKGGIYNVSYIDTTDTDDIGITSSNGSFILNVNNSLWEDLPIHFTSGRIKSKMKNDEQGKYYENSVPGQIKTMKAEINYILDKMSDYRYILRFHDKTTDQYYIIGNTRYPLQLVYDFDSEDSSGASVYDIEFFNETTVPMLNIPPA